jgi:hypothetical protein
LACSSWASCSPPDPVVIDGKDEFIMSMYVVLLQGHDVARGYQASSPPTAKEGCWLGIARPQRVMAQLTRASYSIHIIRFFKAVCVSVAAVVRLFTHRSNDRLVTK